jgi:hypothetical protein
MRTATAACNEIFSDHGGAKFDGLCLAIVQTAREPGRVTATARQGAEGGGCLNDCPGAAKRTGHAGVILFGCAARDHFY